MAVGTIVEPRLSGTETRPVAVALLMVTFLTGVDTVVVATALPAIVGQLGGVNLYAWAFSGYLLTSMVSVPLYGKFADLYGRKSLFLLATGIFMLSSALCGQAQTMEQLIAFRFLQGVGAGGVQSLSLTIIGDVFSIEQRARMMGLFSAVWGVSAVIGPAIGGFLTEQVSWRWVFYVNIPLSLLSMLLVWLFLRERVERKAHRIDYLGAVLLSAAVTALLFGLYAPAAGGRGTTVNPALVALGIVLFGAFGWQEKRAAEPLLALELLGNRAIGVAALGTVATGAAIFTQSAFVPPFVQGVMGASPTVAGFVVVCTSLGWSAAATVIAPFLARWGYRRSGLVGAAFLTTGSLLLVALPPGASLVVTALVQVVIGAGFGTLVPVVTFSMQNAVPWEQRGTVTAVNQFARNIGGTVGVSIAGVLFASALGGLAVDPNVLLSPTERDTLDPTVLAGLQDVFAGALRQVYWLLTAVGVAAVVASLFLPGGHPDDHAWHAQT